MTKSSDWTKYDEVEERCLGDIQLSSDSKGYSLLGPTEEPAEGAPPQLTPQDIHGGYGLLGSPAQGEGNKPSSSLRPDSTYSEVRNEGDSFAPVKKSPPSQANFGDYFLVGSLSDGNESQPLPASGMTFSFLEVFCKKQSPFEKWPTCLLVQVGHSTLALDKKNPNFIS